MDAQQFVYGKLDIELFNDLNEFVLSYFGKINQSLDEKQQFIRIFQNYLWAEVYFFFQVGNFSFLILLQILHLFWNILYVLILIFYWFYWQVKFWLHGFCYKFDQDFLIFRVSIIKSICHISELDNSLAFSAVWNLGIL